MATTNPVAATFAHILVPTDFSQASERALKYAKALAQQSNSDLLLVHVNPAAYLSVPADGAWIAPGEIEAVQADQLERIGAALCAEGYRARVISLDGELCDQLLSAIKQNKVDFIVLGTHGRKGFDRLLVGSDAEAILRRVACPVLTVGPAVPDLGDKTWRIREVLCATTFDPNSAETAAYAQKFAAQQGAELVFFHVKNPGSQEEVDWASFDEAFRHYAAEDKGVRSWLRTRIVSEAPGDSIVDLARQRGSDLIVMGAKPASSLATHLGPGTVARVLMHVPCPVITLLQS